MADLFVSYKAEDRERVRPLVDALSADALSVWWDAHIGAGEAWRNEIERELAAARCVLVAWSRRSVGPEGSFVRDEASRALRRGVYLPVLIDPVEPPLGFGELQGLPLTGWRGDRADPRYAAVRDAARTLIAGGPRPAFHAKPAPAPGGIDRRWLIGGGAALAAAAAGGGWLLLRAPAARHEDSIAVLPFKNLSGDPAQAYLADGLAEEVRGTLARINQLRVAGRTSSDLVRDLDAKAAASKLGVASILMGSVRSGAGNIRVSTQLLDGSDGLERWSNSFDRPLGDALDIQTSIAEGVAAALRIALAGADRELLAAGGTRNAAAQDAFLRARALELSAGSALTVRSNLVRDAYARAIALDPGYALARAAYARHSVYHANEGLAEGALGAALARAEENARLAITLAPKLGPSHAALATALRFQLDFRGAAAAYADAIRLAPDDGAVLEGYAEFQSLMGRFDQALALLDRLAVVDPLRPSLPENRGGVLSRARRWKEAIAAFREARARVPGSLFAPRELSRVFIASGDLAAARRVLAELPANDWLRLTYEAVLHARLDDRGAADRALAALQNIDDGNLNYQFAQVHAQRGETEAAFAAIERAWEAVDSGLMDLKIDPFMDPIRPDQRFAAWIARLGFPA